MKNILLIIAVSLMTLANTAFSQSLEWARGFGGSNEDRGSRVCADVSGNVYSTGFFAGTVDFDPGPDTLNLTATGNRDVFIQKMDPLGNLLWAKAIGGSSADQSQDISMDATGNIYVTGFFGGTVDFDPGSGTDNLSSAGARDVFVLKLDSAGDYLWARVFGGPNDDLPRSIEVSPSGEVHTTGYFLGTANFDPGAATFNLNAIGGRDIFVQKMDASGNFLWAKSFGGTSNDQGQGISVDAQGNVLTTGIFSDSVDFDPDSGVFSLIAAGNEDIFVHKLDASGNFLWARALSGGATEQGYSIDVDVMGNVYTAGSFGGSVDFDPGPGMSILSSGGSFDAFVQKMDSAGNYLWAKAFGGNNTIQAFDIAVDDAGDVLTTGSFGGSLDFDPDTGSFNLTSAGSVDIFVQKLSSSGQFQWAASAGGSGPDAGGGIFYDGNNNVYITGYFSDSADFDPGAGSLNIGSEGSLDIFVQKLNACSPTFGTDVQSACFSFTWIDGNVYTTSNNSATFTLTNAAGCDSIVTLDLTINTVSNNTTFLSGQTISSNNLQASYQWLDCNNNFAVIPGATSQTFTPTSNGSYAVEVTENGCVDTSDCVVITGIVYLDNEHDTRIYAFPNPNQGIFILDLGIVSEQTQVNILDLRGQLLKSEFFESTREIELTFSAPAGIYLLEVISGEKKSTIKLIKE